MSAQPVVIIEVPSALGLRPNGVEDAPTVLHAAGLPAAVGAVDVVQVDVPPYDPGRDLSTGLLNGDQIALLARRLASRVEAVIRAGRFPLVVGGDCSLILGPLLALRLRGRYGLAFVDGHADFQHPDDEPTGEVASLDLALATGRGPAVLSDLAGRGPLTRDEDVVVIGYRAFGDNDRYVDEHVRDTAMTVLDLPHLREHGVDASVRPARDYWVHFDVDVLEDELMPAVDHHQPGGLTWEEAEALLASLLGNRGAVGIDVTIYNPRLDPDRRLAARLTNLLAAAIQRQG